MSESSRPYPWLLPRWLWVFLVLVLAGGVALQSRRATSDPGLANVWTMLLAILAALVVAIWFLLGSRFRWRTRLGTLGVSVLAVAAFLGLFRFDGFSGSMVPRFAPRSRPPAPAGAPLAGVEAIDLATATEDDFPGFLGPDRSMSVRHVQLWPDWNSRPPEEVWRRPVGPGWSAFAVVNAYGVTMEQRGDQEMVTAYDLRDGEPRWAYGRPGGFDHPLGGLGPRSTPLIDDGMVYALTATGVLVALDGGTGELVWEHDLLQEFGVTPQQEFANVQYGRSNSPLVVDDLVIIPAGGNPDRPPASLVAYHRRTGEKVWEGGERQISFSSPRWATVAGVEQILIVNEDTASGHDPATGKVLWEHPWPGRTAANATASQAVPVEPDRVFLSKGYGEGASLIQLLPRDDGTFETRTVWHNRSVMRTKLTNVALLDDHVYGLSQGILECVDVHTGTRVWKRGRYGHGQMLLVDRSLLILTEDGELVHVEASPDRPNRVLGRLQALTGQTWNNLALYGEYLVLRNAREAVVYRLPLAEREG